jgi:hypothetical protein
LNGYVKQSLFLFIIIFLLFKVTALKENYEPRPGGPQNAFDALKRVQVAIESLLKRADQVIGEAEQGNSLSPVSIDSLKKARTDVFNVGEYPFLLTKEPYLIDSLIKAIIKPNNCFPKAMNLHRTPEILE